MPKKTTPKSITLTPEQEAVVSAREGAYRIMASPGSGKSSVLVQRYIRLLESRESPDQILSLTFTATAAKNLRDRVEARVGKLNTKRVAGASTFHGLSLALIQEERDELDFKIADFPLATEPIANKFAAEAARRHEVDGRSLRSAISLWKRRRVRASSAVRSAEEKLDAKTLKLALGYKTYEKRCKEEGLLDFDSLLLEFVELLSKKASVRERHQYKWCQADEAQDCCEIEWSLLQLLTEKHGNICAVGDANQNIYSFRGSDSKLFINMEDRFPGVQKLYLGQNFRSSPQIVSFIKGIGTVQELCEHFTTNNPPGPKIEAVGFRNSAEEAVYIIGKIKESLNG